MCGGGEAERLASCTLVSLAAFVASPMSLISTKDALGGWRGAESVEKSAPVGLEVDAVTSSSTFNAPWGVLQRTSASSMT